jgi:hypothetical protein
MTEVIGDFKNDYYFYSPSIKILDYLLSSLDNDWQIFMLDFC